MSFIINSYQFASGGASLLLDTYPAAVAYSLRKLRSSYSGSAIRVRRSSDNTEQDIGFSGNDLDASALTTFCSGTNGYVTKWYDQSGNGIDAAQTTGSVQPMICLSGVINTDANGNYTIHFNYLTSSLLVFTGGGAVYKDKGYINAFTVVENAEASSRRDIWGWYTANNSILRIALFSSIITSNRYDLRGRRLDSDSAQSVTSGTNFTVNVPTLITSIGEWANSNGYLYEDGTLTATNTSWLTDGNTSNTDSVVTMRAGNNTSGIGYFSIGTPVKYITEIIFYNTNESANRSSIESDIMTYYGL